MEGMHYPMVCHFRGCTCCLSEGLQTSGPGLVGPMRIFFRDVTRHRDQFRNNKRVHFLDNYPLAKILIIFLFQV